MPRHGKEINLSSGIDDVMGFDDSRLSDAEFEKRLVWEIYNDDWGVRDGTSDRAYCDNVLRIARRDVAKAIEENGIGDRNKVITAAYNKSSNCEPNAKFPKTDSPFLQGSDYLKWARGETARSKQARRP